MYIERQKRCKRRPCSKCILHHLVHTVSDNRLQCVTVGDSVTAFDSRRQCVTYGKEPVCDRQ